MTSRSSSLRSLRKVRRLEPYLRRVPLGAQYLVLARKPLTPSSS